MCRLEAPAGCRRAPWQACASPTRAPSATASSSPISTDRQTAARRRSERSWGCSDRMFASEPQDRPPTVTRDTVGMDHGYGLDRGGESGFEKDRTTSPGFSSSMATSPDGVRTEKALLKAATSAAAEGRRRKDSQKELRRRICAQFRGAPPVSERRTAAGQRTATGSADDGGSDNDAGADNGGGGELTKVLGHGPVPLANIFSSSMVGVSRSRSFGITSLDSHSLAFA